MTQTEIAALINPFILERRNAGAEYITTDEIYDWLYIRDPNILRTWEPGQIKAPNGIKKTIGDTMTGVLGLVNIQKSGKFRLKTTEEALSDS